jgi:hypothetical protein
LRWNFWRNRAFFAFSSAALNFSKIGLFCWPVLPLKLGQNYAYYGKNGHSKKPSSQPLPFDLSPPSISTPN